MWPGTEDNLERLADDPPGWHVRELVDLDGKPGYPLMGSSPAERYESLERGARIEGQAMRDHLFVGDGPYCEDWQTLADRMTGEGRLVMRSRCGYRRRHHPVLDVTG